MSQKMTNSIDVKKKLQETYLPHNATLVRLADAAMVKGRAKLRATREAANEAESERRTNVGRNRGMSKWA